MSLCKNTDDRIDLRAKDSSLNDPVASSKLQHPLARLSGMIDSRCRRGPQTLNNRKFSACSSNPIFQIKGSASEKTGRSEIVPARSPRDG